MSYVENVASFLKHLPLDFNEKYRQVGGIDARNKNAIDAKTGLLDFHIGDRATQSPIPNRQFWQAVTRRCGSCVQKLLIE